MTSVRAMRSARRRHEAGSALLVAMMMLVLMGLIGFSALDTVTRDRQIAGAQTRARASLYAAEAGAVSGLNLVRTADSRDDTPAMGTTSLGDAASYMAYAGQPSFRGDPAAAGVPIRWVMDGAPAEGMNLQSPPQFVNTLWRVRVQGDTADGAASRIDSMATKVLDANY